MKHLKIAVLKTPWGKLLRVAEQTHRRSEFGVESSIFRAKSGFRLWSNDCPIIMRGYFGLFVRGKDSSLDNRVAFVHCEEWLRECRLAVREYNTFFAGAPDLVTDDSDIEVIE
jgi:hypothetical protein